MLSGSERKQDTHYACHNRTVITEYPVRSTGGPQRRRRGCLAWAARPLLARDASGAAGKYVDPDRDPGKWLLTAVLTTSIAHAQPTYGGLPWQLPRYDRSVYSFVPYPYPGGHKSVPGQNDLCRYRRRPGGSSGRTLVPSPGAGQPCRPPANHGPLVVDEAASCPGKPGSSQPLRRPIGP